MSKNISSLVLLTTLFLSATSFCPAQDSFYKHYEGKVGENIFLVAEMMSTDGMLSGYYYYYFDEKTGDTSWTYFGKSLPVTGKITKDGSVEFSESQGGKQGSLFKGTLSESQIKGTWMSADGHKSLPFEMNEGYPEGTMSFDLYKHRDEMDLIEGKSGAKATLEIFMALPSPGASKPAADSVAAYVIGKLFGSDQPGLAPAALMEREKEVYFKNYRSSNLDIYQEGSASFNWEKSEVVRIQHNKYHILTLEIFDYGYTGGAHGLGFSTFAAFDLRDGHRISLQEIFRSDFQSELREIVNDQLRKDYDVNPGQTLADAGFFVEMVDPGSNFYINREGIGFYYNPYEVAPYSTGPVDVFIPYSKMKRIMAPGSPIATLAAE
jgi:hypothetical protein